MKKAIKILMATLALILLLLLTIPLMFKGKIENIIKVEGNKLLNAKFDFKRLNISLIKNFPLASVTLEDFYLKGVDEFENDTLVAADEITASVNLISIFGDEGYDIQKILLDGVSLNAVVLSNGNANWNVVNFSDSDTLDTDEIEIEEVADVEESESSFRIKLQELRIKDFNLIYDDRESGIYARIENFDADCSGDFGSVRTLVDLNAAIEALTFKMDGVPFLNRASLAANMNIDADFENNRFTLNKNTLQLNAIKAAVDGWVALTDAGVKMDIKLNSNEIGFKEILSLVPAIYTKDFEGLRTDGTALLTAYAKGELIGDSILPAFNLALDVKDAMFRYPSLPAGVDNINIAAEVSNPGGSLDATIVRIAPFGFSMAGNPFSLKATVVTPMSDIAFDATAVGTLDLGKIKDIYPLDDIALNGVVKADVNINGKMSYIEKEQYEKIKASGSVQLNNMLVQMQELPDIDIKKSLFTFTPRYLQLSETTVNIGNSDITFDSKFDNYIGFALKGTTLKGELNVKSKMLNLNDFMSGEEPAEETKENTPEEPVDTAAATVIRVPENINFKMQVNFDKVLFDKMVFDKLNGQLVVKDGKVDMKNLSLNTMGGNMLVNGYYSAPENVEPEFNAGIKLNNILFVRAYQELNLVQKMAPIFNGLTGDFSGSVNLKTKLDDSMSPVLSTLTGNGSLSTKDLSLNNIKAIQMVADIAKKPSIKETKVKDLNVEFSIADGRVNTKPFDIKLGDVQMKLSGSTGLDQTIDYKGEITLPTTVGKLSQLGTVDMAIGGTFTSPKVSIDTEALLKKAASKAAENVIDKLLGGSSEKAPEQQDTTPKSSEEKKKEVAGKLLNKAFELLKK